MTGEGQARVLVVEDNAVNRLALVKGVQREGHQVVAAADGREALERLRTEPVETVLLDLLMPVMDGFEVLAAMRSDAELADVPVIVISAVEDVDSIARAIELGAVDVLPKPVEPVLLRVRLRTALAQRRLRRVEQAYLHQELALREQERLAALGRLTAGLAHELNNPAAAALRIAQQLERQLTDSARLLADVPPAAAAALPRHGGSRTPPQDVADLEDAIERLLEAHGVRQPWKVAGELAQAGTAPGELEPMLVAAGGQVSAAAAWAAQQLGVRRSLRELLASVERVSTIVTAMRSYSYLDRGQEQDVDIHRSLDDTLAVLAHDAGGVTVRREYAARLPLVRGSGGQLNQVWTNLVDNALDALAGSGTLTLATRAEDRWVVVEVEDDGPGIPPALRGRVFDPFVTGKAPGRGVGLGLTVAHQIVVEQHGGRLSVESRPGRTVFTVRLPLP